MEISQIRSTIDLINFYGERDTNKNGRIENNEFENIAQYDRNGDHMLLPWEVMEAVNNNQNSVIFYSEHINQVRELNESGIPFQITIQNYEADITINEITYKAGTKIEFYYNGQVRVGTLAFDQIVQGINFGAGTRIESHGNGKIWVANIISDTFIYNETYEAGTRILFDENGKIISASCDSCGEYSLAHRRGLRLLFAPFTISLGLGGIFYNSLSDEFRNVPPHPDDIGAATAPIETIDGNYFKGNVGFDFIVDFWQYLYLRYRLSSSGGSEYVGWEYKSWENLEEGGYQYPPAHRQRYSSGENAFTFIGSSWGGSPSHLLTLGIPLARSTSGSFNIEAGFTVRGDALVRGWDRYAKIEFLNTEDLWEGIFGMNFRLSPVSCMNTCFTGGNEVGLNFNFSQATFGVSLSFALMFGLETFQFIR